RFQLAGQIMGKVDVAWRVEVGAGNKPNPECARALIRNERPGLAREQHGMAAISVVARGKHGPCSVAPGGNQPLDGPRIEPGPVGEDDERRLRLLWKRAEPAAE